VNQLATAIVDEATGDGQPADEPVGEPKEKAVESGKNPAAVALGRLGGLKGGKARAEKLTKEQRSEIARKAAQARWAENEGHDQ